MSIQGEIGRLSAAKASIAASLQAMGVDPPSGTTLEQYAAQLAAIAAAAPWLSLTGGTMTGPIVLNGPPTDENHAANKQYVDGLVGTTADKLAYLQGAKEAIREAIESLGGTVPDGLPFRQYASRIRNLAINSLDVPEGDVQVTCRISPTGQIRVEGPFAYPLSDTYYLSLEGDELPELGNMRCPKGAIIQITPLSGGGNVYVPSGSTPPCT